MCHFLPGICETTPILHFLMHNFEIQLLQSWLFQFFWFQLSSSTWNNSKPLNFLYIHMIGKNFLFLPVLLKKKIFFPFRLTLTFFLLVSSFQTSRKFGSPWFFFTFSFLKFPPECPIDVLKILGCDMPWSVHNPTFWFFRYPKNP